MGEIVSYVIDAFSLLESYQFSVIAFFGEKGVGHDRCGLKMNIFIGPISLIGLIGLISLIRLFSAKIRDSFEKIKN